MLLRTETLRQTLLSGLAAGAVGGVLLHGWLLLTLVVIRRMTDPATVMKFVASAVMGSAAFSNPSAPLVGTLLFYTVALLWGMGYAYVASTEPQLTTRPLVSGIAFGITVFVIMQIVELTLKIWTWNPANLLGSVIGHVLCFGIPVAYVVARWPYRT